MAFREPTNDQCGFAVTDKEHQTNPPVEIYDGQELWKTDKGVIEVRQPPLAVTSQRGGVSCHMTARLSAPRRWEQKPSHREN